MNQDLFHESIDTFKVKFEGGNTIDAELFIRTINNTIELVKATANAIDPTAFLRLEIRATKEGSFETIIDTIVKHPMDLINKDNIRLAAEIITGYLSFLQIKSHLKGRKPKTLKQTQEGTTITNHEDQEITATTNIVNCYLNNSKVDNTIIQIFTDLKASGREGIIIEHQDKKETFKKTDYEHMSANIVEEDKPIISKSTSQLIEKCRLTVKKPDLRGNSKWEVIFDRKIDVKIADEEFLQQIREGIIKFSGFSVLICDLNIRTETDDEYNPISIEYTVTKVHDIEDKEKQSSLF